MIESFTKQTPGLRRRHAAEQRFQWAGRLAILAAVGFLVVMAGSLGWMGAGAFKQTHIGLEVYLDPQEIDPGDLPSADYGGLVKAAMRARFPEVQNRRDKRKLYQLVSSEAPYTLQELVSETPGLIGQTLKIWFIASDDLDMLIKGNITVNSEAPSRRYSEMTLGWVNSLEQNSDIETRFNSRFLLAGDSREPELAGIFSAFIGTVYTLLVCFVLSFPVGILAAIYLEEFAPKSRWNDFIEVNINNLAAVPSIVFGLLGLAIFLNTFGLPRSSPLVGGMVLALMTLPTIIIASRVALRSVPPSIREAAFGIGATPVQAVFHHVAPLALPGMLTGTIIGMARALGETAPLLMIGMVAFIVDVPDSVLQPATALPVQIFLWADSPERAFLEKTSAAIIVLILLLIAMNLLAIVLRQRFRQRF